MFMKWPARLWPKVARQGLAIGVLLLGISEEPLAVTVPPRVEIIPERDFGYVMGDVIRQTLIVTTPADQMLDTTALPRPGPVNDWLDIRDISWESQPGSTEQIHHIYVQYQIFKGLRGPEQVSLPGLPLHFGGASPLDTTGPDWPIALLPIIPVTLSSEEVELRPPMLAQPMPTDAHWRILWLWLSAGMTVGLYAGRHYWLGLRRTRPLLQARQDVCKLLQAPLTRERLNAAVRTLHTGLDHSHGATLFGHQVGLFCSEKPSFADLEAELEAFFNLSNQLFFATDSSALDLTASAKSLAMLAKRLATAERRAA
jgi:mxaA protein